MIKTQEHSLPSIGALFFIFLDNDDEDVDGYGIW